MATLYIDKQPYEVDPAKNVLAACLELGFDLPYFCWHPALGSVGACRQCAVRQFRDEDDERGQITMACMIPAADQTRISIDDPEAREFRASVIEWLMTNHPHDCPVCDEGGECHLQDMTVMTGHACRRFRFNKRTFRNQELGPFINHEMNRCIQCYRCVRFYKDFAGGDDLDAFSSHNHVYFGRHEDGVLESPFSGNLVEVCPTGVFTDKTLGKHYTRKWDLQSAPSICVHCSLGCNTLAGSRYGTVRRILNRYHGDVNGYFLCDRGRFGYEFTNSPDRVREPSLRDAGGSLRPASEAEATQRLREALARRDSLIGIGSPRATLESNFALRALVGPERFHHGVADREFRILTAIVEILRKGPIRAPSLTEISRCDAVLVLGEDLLATAPRMALAVRQALREAPMQKVRELKIPLWHDKAVRDVMQDDRGPLFLATPAATGMDREARTAWRAAPLDIARLGFAVAAALDTGAPAPSNLDGVPSELASKIAKSLREARRPLIISGTSSGSLRLVHAAASVALALRRSGSEVALSYVMPECNSLGLALLGGRDMAEAFAAARSGSIDTAIVLENDLHRRAAPRVIEEFLASIPNLVVLDGITGRTTARAGLVLPAATFAEGAGTYVNNEGRAQRAFRALDADPLIREAWRWLDAARENGPQWRNLDELTAAIEKECPSLHGVVEAAPSAHFRAHGQKVPRSSQRLSGRTAIHAARDIHEPKPPDDPDSALASSMEGLAGRPPAALITHYWAAGWNSVQSLNKFQAEIGGALRDGDAGKRLIEPSSASDMAFFQDVPEEQPSPTPDQLLIVPLHTLFGSEELSARAAAVMTRIPKATLVVHPADAAERNLEAHHDATLTIQGETCRLPVEIRDDIPRGVAGYPTGCPSLPFFELPLPGNIA